MTLERSSAAAYTDPVASVRDEDEVDLAQLLASVWAGRYILAAFVAAFAVLGALYYIAAAPVYETIGLVQVEQDSQSPTADAAALGTLSAMLGAPTETESEIQILQSQMVLGAVIKALNLEIDAQPKYLPLFGQFVARKHANAQAPVAPLLGLKSYAWGGESITVTKFDVPATLLDAKFTLTAIGADRFVLRDANDNIVIKDGRVGVEAQAPTADGPLKIFVQDLRARPDTCFVVVKWAMEDVLRNLRNQLQIVEQGKQSGIIGLTADGPSPSYVAAVVQQIEDAYVRQNVQRRSAEAQQSLNFLKQQLPEIKERVDAAQAKLNAYQVQRGSVNVTKETDLILQQAVDLETQRLQLVAQKEQALQRFTAQHPVVQALDAQIKNLDAEEADIKKRSQALPSTQQEVLSLMRDLEVNEQLYTTLLNSSQQLQVAKAGTVGNVRIIDEPLTPRKPVKPKFTLVVALSIVLGLILGTAWLFLRRALFRGVDRPDEIERALGLSTYAAVPYSAGQKRLARAARAKAPGSHILAALEPDNVAVEALRSLRTSLQFALLEAGNNLIALSGPTPGLGKSFVSINLACVLAQGGKRVVVIDGDLRRGHLHKYVGAAAAPGLSDYIAGDVELPAVLKPTQVKGLTLLANGTTPPNPAELLMHDRFTALLQQLSHEYDLVIIDTPPILPVADASIIGRSAGCVFLILKEGEHPMRSIDESLRRFRQAGVQIRGVIFNQVGAAGGGYSYYNTYSYSYKSRYKSEVR
ncbi:polysaccharide biosynthesis tyrosine autokinase [Solimonas marina]|uniref:Polysaccharide biosynthesis tyrosine autokinase n=1 Tax=Solimonas marina TaxID=2714601 RepID=A0A969W9D2_9GAMM|nr:polysaccharide biosynthesis tyrosine autokinase [Solimonas marina]NKF21888.1 polysaccharide biosynthesis tyrosine autokinase [Solimonas marina]